MNKRTDIAQQIKRYLDGELDARAMHELERRAQDDPLLMEALEGYENTGKPQDENLKQLTQRLNARIAQKERRTIPWRAIATAAAVLVFMGVGLLWLTRQQPVVQNDLSKLVNPVKHEAKKPADTLPVAVGKSQQLAYLDKNSKAKRYTSPKVAPLAEINEVPKSSSDANADVTVESPVGYSDTRAAETVPSALNRKRDSTPLNEMIVTQYSAEKHKDVANSVASIQPLQATDKLASQLQGKVAGVSINKEKTRPVAGVVKDADTPIPGVTVKVKGTAIATHTDAKGRFKLPAVPDKAVLDFTYIGYDTKELPVRKTDSLVVAMQPGKQSLSEVVVVGYGTKKEDTEEQAAQPARGWNEYKQYLTENAVSPNGKTGIVKLSFIVNANNSLSDFKIIKSLDSSTDDVAIKLIQDGPDWLSNTGGKAEKVSLRIKFRAKK